MSVGRTEVNGAFQISDFREPNTTTVNTLIANCARVETVKGRGKGAMTITMHTNSGALISVVVQLSSEVEKKLVFIVYKETAPAASTILNKVNTTTTGDTTMVSVNIASTATITKFEADIQGKLESGSVGNISSDFLYAEYNTCAAALYPAGFSDNTAGATNYDKWVNMKGATYGADAELAGKVTISAPGRGHLGTIHSL